MCLYPQLIKNRKYTETAKNGGNVPPVYDIRTLYVPKACGKCIECRRQTARNWQARLLEDIKHNPNGMMVTLTFSDQSILELTAHIHQDFKGYDRDNQIATRAVHLFRERWRKATKKSIRHWLVTELGHNGTENIHLHGILWNNDFSELDKRWEYGFIRRGWYVNSQTVNYSVKYVHKMDEDHPNYKSIVLTSPGIGRGYINESQLSQWVKNKYNGTNTNETYRTDTGHKMAMPGYWKDHIYTDDEKEKLWIQKLDKLEGYVLGQKIDVSKTEKMYEEVLQRAREKNKRLGYGDNTHNPEQLEYETKKRIIMQKTREERAKAKQNKAK